MAAFCGMNYDELKSVVSLSVTFNDGLNIREGVELETPLVKKLEKGKQEKFAGEIFRARDGSVRIRLLDGSGFGSIYSMEGTAFLSAPPTPAVESSTASTTVSTVIVRVKNHRFLASYTSALKKLGFSRASSGSCMTYPGVVTFESEQGVERSQLEAAFEPLVAGHLSRFYDFPIPARHRSPEWWKYEMWMEYKKEISIWAD